MIAKGVRFIMIELFTNDGLMGSRHENHEISLNRGNFFPGTVSVSGRLPFGPIFQGSLGVVGAAK